MHIFGIYYDIYLCSRSPLPDMVSGKLYQARFDSCCLVNCFSMKPFQGQSAFGFRISFSWAMQMSRRCGTFTLRGGSASNNAHFWRVHKKTTPDVVICVSIKETRLMRADCVRLRRRGVNNGIVIRRIIHVGRGRFIRDPYQINLTFVVQIGAH